MPNKYAVLLFYMITAMVISTWLAVESFATLGSIHGFIMINCMIATLQEEHKHVHELCSCHSWTTWSRCCFKLAKCYPQISLLEFASTMATFLFLVWKATCTEQNIGMQCNWKYFSKQASYNNKLYLSGMSLLEVRLFLYYIVFQKQKWFSPLSTNMTANEVLEAYINVFDGKPIQQRWKFDQLIHYDGNTNCSY